MKTDQKLIDETRDLIDAVRAGHVAVAEHDNDQDVSRTIDERDIVRRAEEDQVDGCATVEISDDEMTAYVSLYPPQGFGRPLEPARIYELLEEAGVVHGVRGDLVEAALFTCNTERVTLYAIEVAFGRPPRHGAPERIRPIDHEDAPPSAHDDEPVDHRVRSTLSLVTAGMKLAVVEPEVVGSDGTTVTGTIVPHQVRTTASLELGENVGVKDGHVVAMISGLLHLEGGVVSVTPTLPLAKGVGYHTGNIDFDGDVVLGERIADGFTIRCSGTLAASVTIDAFGISCNTLSGSQGLIGHGETTVEVAADASLRFVQNARLRLGGSLRIAQSVLKSHITAHDSVELAHGSSIVASTIRAGLGAEVFNVGAAGAAASEFYLGIDFGVSERLATIRDQTLALSGKLRDVRLVLSHGERTSQLTALEEELQAAIATLAGDAGQLVSHLDRDEDAALVVHGTIHAGTYIEICHRSLLVDRSRSRCTLRLDRKTGSIVVDALGASKKGN